MSGYLASCGTYYADRRREPCRACRGSGKLPRSAEPCKCPDCKGGFHMTLDQGRYGKQPKVRTSNSDLFGGSLR